MPRGRSATPTRAVPSRKAKTEAAAKAATPAPPAPAAPAPAEAPATPTVAKTGEVAAAVVTPKSPVVKQLVVTEAAAAAAKPSSRQFELWWTLAGINVIAFILFSTQFPVALSPEWKRVVAVLPVPFIALAQASSAKSLASGTFAQQSLLVAFFYTVHQVATALLPAAQFGQLHTLLGFFVPASLMVAFSKWDTRLSAPLVVAVGGLLLGLEAYHAGGPKGFLSAYVPQSLDTTTFLQPGGQVAQLTGLLALANAVVGCAIAAGARLAGDADADTTVTAAVAALLLSSVSAHFAWPLVESVIRGLAADAPAATGIAIARQALEWAALWFLTATIA